VRISISFGSIIGDAPAQLRPYWGITRPIDRDNLSRHHGVLDMVAPATRDGGKRQHRDAGQSAEGGAAGGLEAAGILFVEENGAGPGVRLRKEKT
jgi:hypothetical protein